MSNKTNMCYTKTTIMNEKQIYEKITYLNKIDEKKTI